MESETCSPITTNNKLESSIIPAPVNAREATPPNVIDKTYDGQENLSDGKASFYTPQPVPLVDVKQQQQQPQPEPILELSSDEWE